MQASDLLRECDTAWRQCDMARRLDNSIAVLRSTLDRQQLSLARFEWLFEDDVIISTSGLVQPKRQAVMSDLRKVHVHPFTYSVTELYHAE